MGLFLTHIGQALLMAFGMFWSVGWSLVLGFLISAVIQVFVSKEKMSALLGGDGPKEIALATGFGAASSSCSYASAAITRSLIQKGAGFIPSLAFLFSSTNLVIELGIILYLLMGWQFTAAEWIGGVVMVAVMSVLVRLTYPWRLIEEARQHAAHISAEHGHAVSPVQNGRSFGARLFSSEALVAIARSFVMDWSMLWKDLAAGFLIAGFLSVFVPIDTWRTLFVTSLSPALQMPLNALVGPLIAVISFVCSIGNVPMAAVLWGSGISFGGVLAFLYADLIVLPLLDAYRRYFGWKTAAYIGFVFYITMVLTGIIMDGAFSAFGLVPHPNPNIREQTTHFTIDYTFWLNLALGAVAAYLFVLSAKSPMQAHHRHG
jgi:uncharacterized protein